MNLMEIMNRFQYLLIAILLMSNGNNYLNSTDINCPKVCTCSHINNHISVDCNDQNLTHLPPIGTETEYLYLSRNEFNDIPNAIANLSSIELLTMSENNITEVNMNILNQLKYLKYLDLSNNPFINWQSIHLDQLLNSLNLLEVLNLEYNPQLSSIFSNQNNFKLINSNLKQLNLRNCNITKIHNKYLITGLSNLQKLILADNSIAWFNEIISASLEVLDLSNSNVYHILTSAFVHLPSLKELRLNENDRLTTFQSKSPYSNSLRILHLDNCNVGVEYLVNFPNLTHIYLNGNHIRQLDMNSFINNQNVEMIDLTQTGLTSINSNTFTNLNKLTHLILADNQLETLESTVFESNKLLKIVILARNRFNHFQQLQSESIVQLDLSHCDINELQWDSIIDMTHLRKLDLSYNSLETFPDLFESTTLKYLNLDNNYIEQLTDKSFVRLKALKYLSLAGNRLSNRINFQMFPKSLEFIELNNNPWICECHSKEFRQLYEYLLIPPSKVFDVNLLQCNFPPNVSGENWAYACRHVWYVTRNERTALNNPWVLVVICALSVCIFFSCLLTTRRMIIERQRIENAEQARLAEEAHQLICRMRQRQRDTAQEIEIIDARDLVPPPTYEQALHMKRPNSIHDLRIKSSHSDQTDNDNQTTSNQSIQNTTETSM